MEPDYAAAILALVEARGPEKSICPSEAARAVAPDWRAHLKGVREAALRLAREGRIEVLRKGRTVETLDAVRGVIRLRIKRGG